MKIRLLLVLILFTVLISGCAEEKADCGECEYFKNGTCVEYECCEDSQCNYHEFCNNSNQCEWFTCEDNKGYINHTCIDLDCGENQIFKLNTCKDCDECEYVEDNTCKAHDCCEDEDCDGYDVCINHTCVEYDWEYECTKNSHCYRGEICSNHTCIELQCEEHQKIWNLECVDWDNCQYLDKLWGERLLYYYDNEKYGCCEDKHCGSSMVCNNSQCVYLECGECQKIGNHECVDLECCYNKDCSSGEVCWYNECKEFNTSSCGLDENQSIYSTDCWMLSEEECRSCPACWFFYGVCREGEGFFCVADGGGWINTNTRTGVMDRKCKCPDGTVFYEASSEDYKGTKPIKCWDCEDFEGSGIDIYECYTKLASEMEDESYCDLISYEYYKEECDSRDPGDEGYCARITYEAYKEKCYEDVRCSYLECCSSNDCSYNEFCDNNLCVEYSYDCGECQKRGGGGCVDLECCYNKDCNSGEVCWDNGCKEIDFSSCGLREGESLSSINCSGLSEDECGYCPACDALYAIAAVECGDWGCPEPHYMECREVEDFFCVASGGGLVRKKGEYGIYEDCNCPDGKVFHGDSTYPTFDSDIMGCNGCEILKDAVDIHNCYVSMAYDSENESYCDLISYEEYKEECSDYRGGAGYEARCNATSYDTFKARCYRDVRRHIAS